MVSFNCSVCQDVVKKPKVATHFAGCRGTFTCVDCMKVFDINSVKDHTSCISETSKYQRSWQGPKKKEKLDTSDEEEEREKEKQHQLQLQSGKKAAGVRRARINFSDTDMSDDDAAAKSKKPQAKAAAAPAKSSSSASAAAAGPATSKPAEKAPSASATAAKPSTSSGPVSVSFTVSASAADFKALVQQELGTRWNSGDAVSAKAAAKVLSESAAVLGSKELKAALQQLVVQHCGESVNVE
jgi:hypothetical protein